MIGLISVALYFGIVPCLLHEFGHWLMLHHYKIAFKPYFNFRKFLFGFQYVKSNPNWTDLTQAVKVGLAGAFTPLLSLVPLPFIHVGFLWFGMIPCLMWSLWTCYEVWRNVNWFEKGRKTK